MSHIAEQGGATSHGIKLLLCENPFASAINDKPKACDILIRPLKCIGEHFFLSQ